MAWISNEQHYPMPQVITLYGYMELRVSKTVYFCSLLPSNTSPMKGLYVRTSRGHHSFPAVWQGAVFLPSHSSRGASSPALLHSGAHHHGTCQMPGAQTDPRRDQTDSRKAGALLTTKKYAPDSNFSCGHRGNTSEAFVTSYGQRLG